MAQPQYINYYRPYRIPNPSAPPLSPVRPQEGLGVRGLEEKGQGQQAQGLRPQAQLPQSQRPQAQRPQGPQGPQRPQGQPPVRGGIPPGRIVLHPLPFNQQPGYRQCISPVVPWSCKDHHFLICMEMTHIPADQPGGSPFHQINGFYRFMLDGVSIN